jgi:hypothetical protein
MSLSFASLTMGHLSSLVTNILTANDEGNHLPSIPFVRPTADHGPPSVLTNRTEIDVWSTAGFTTPTGNGNFSYLLRITFSKLIIVD